MTLYILLASLTYAKVQHPSRSSASVTHKQHSFTLVKTGSVILETQDLLQNIYPGADANAECTFSS